MIDYAKNRRKNMIERFYEKRNKDPQNVFIGGIVIGGAIGFALGILAVAVYVHLMFL